MKIEEFKNLYSKYEKKYKLPSFDELNENFEIDKLKKSSDCFLRPIRKLMMEKIVNSMGFFEMLLNPVNAPRVYYPYIKSMSSSDKNDIDKLYDSLAILSVDSLFLEVDYSEKDEAELIIKSNRVWKDNKPIFKKIITNIKNPQNSVKKEKSYFG